ncbi:MAG: hypothetical protein CVV61_00495 [Tenericutes bacterium HGW-Tenericutes-6]|jgi:hypothetical protein|nr:MAG: hypothetical protein CVV61_00495 [Tenericutes bacterium HGW-Tenericutes-6]
MRKIVMLILFILFLTGCQNSLYIEETTEAYQALSVDYDDYLRHDIVSDQQFHAFINQVTLETATAGMMIEVRIYSSLGALLEVIQFSGIVIHEDANYHILTVNTPFLLETGQTHTITLNDYLGNTLTGELAHQDELLNLAIVTTQRKTVNYEPVSILEQTPMTGEPLVLIGFQGQIINAITMGMMLPIEDQNDDTYKSSIISDHYGLGGAVIDTSFYLVGIQLLSHDDHIVFIKTDVIYHFYQSYLED